MAKEIETSLHRCSRTICSSLSPPNSVVVIWVHLENKQSSFDYIQDLLRVAFDVFYENENVHSPFYQKLSGSTVIAGYGDIADRVIWTNHFENFVHSSVRGIVSLSPSLWRDPTLLVTARNLRVDTLIVAGSTDAWRPISNGRPIYTQIPSGRKSHNGVCKTYVEIVGGNHCYFVDWDNATWSQCASKEIEYPSYTDTAMTHQYQLTQHGTRLLLEYLMFISNPNNESAAEFQQYLIDSREATAEIQYLQSCYVGDVLFAHDQYFPRNTEQEGYRTVL